MRNWLYLFPFLVLITRPAVSQSITNDILLVQAKGDLPVTSSSPKATLNFFEKKIQPQYGKKCVYEMKCGDFAKGVFKEFGPLKGLFLSVDRIGRCTHISSIETLPNRLNQQNKIIEGPKDYRFHP